MSWDNVKFNPFIGTGVGAGGMGVNGVGPSTGGVNTSGGSAVDRELADVKRFFAPFNGTGDLRPNDAPEDSVLKNLYA